MKVEDRICEVIDEFFVIFFRFFYLSISKSFRVYVRRKDGLLDRD